MDFKLFENHGTVIEFSTKYNGSLKKSIIIPEGLEISKYVTIPSTQRYLRQMAP